MKYGYLLSASLFFSGAAYAQVAQPTPKPPIPPTEHNFSTNQTEITKVVRLEMLYAQMRELQKQVSEAEKDAAPVYMKMREASKLPEPKPAEDKKPESDK